MDLISVRPVQYNLPLYGAEIKLYQFPPQKTLIVQYKNLVYGTASK
jgi:hypothetical protein